MLIFCILRLLLHCIAFKQTDMRWLGGWTHSKNPQAGALASRITGNLTQVAAYRESVYFGSSLFPQSPKSLLKDIGHVDYKEM